MLKDPTPFVLSRRQSRRIEAHEAARLLAELDLDPAHWKQPPGTLSIGRDRRRRGAEERWRQHRSPFVDDFGQCKRG